MVAHYSVNRDRVLKRIMRNPTMKTAYKVAGAHEFIGFLFRILTLATLGDSYADEVIPDKYNKGEMEGLLKIDPENPRHAFLVDDSKRAQRATVMLRAVSDFVDAIGIVVAFIAGEKRMVYYFAWNGEKAFFAGRSVKSNNIHAT